MQKQYVIPVFIPEKACPFRCIYCNQFTISSTSKELNYQELIKYVEMRLRTIPNTGKIRVAFFGGTFTGLSLTEQKTYFDLLMPYYHQGIIQGFQLSTRPDYIDSEKLDFLRDYPVQIIELGAQSLHNDVLSASGRGHKVKDVENAADLIKTAGFELGLQMMIGLPKDTPEKALQTAQKIVELKADYARIYPTLVIQNTALAELYLQHKYKALSLEEAVKICVPIVELFDQVGIQTLRIGLHPSEGFISGRDIVDGPFHVSFKELVYSALFFNKIKQNIQNKQGDEITLFVQPEQYNVAIGYYASNRKFLNQIFHKVSFITDETISKNHINVIIK